MIRATIATCLLFPLLAGLAGAQGGGSAGAVPEQGAQVWICPQTAEAYVVARSNQFRVRLERGKAGQESFRTNGLEFGFSPAGWLSVRAEHQEYCLRLEGVSSEWGTGLAAGQQVLLKAMPGSGLVEVMAPPVNMAAVRMRLGEPGWVELQPGGVARYEEFADGSFYVRGNGKVRGFDADGRAVVLGPKTPPMSGGVLAQVRGKDGKTEMKRATPVIAAVLQGEPSGPLNVVVGQQRLLLKADAPQELILPNGARVELGLNQVARSLEWRVEKGYFEFTIAGIAGWRALGLSGQAGLLQWDLASRTASLSNVTPGGDAGGTLLISPGPDLFVALGAESSVQVSELGASGAFALTAYGEEVWLCNLATGRETPLAMKRVILLGRSVPKAGSLRKSGANWVRVGGDASRVELSGEWGMTRLKPGQWKDLPGAGAAKVEATLDRQGELTLRAVGGRALVLSQVDERLGVQLEAGNALRLAVQTPPGTATLSGVAGNQPRGAVLALIGKGGVVSGWPEKGVVEPTVEQPLNIMVERSAQSGEPVATLAWCQAKAGGLAGAGPTRALDRPLQAWVYPETLAAYTVSLDNRISATIDPQKPGQQSFSVAGVLFGISADGWMSVATDCHALELRVAQVCAEWQALIPCGCQVLIKVIPGERIVDIIAPWLNAGTVRMRGCDGGYADIQPGGRARFDQLADQSYYIWSNGRVLGVNADGQTFVLSPKTPPMIGGVLSETRGPDGQVEMRRGSPVTAVLVRGELAGEVTVVVGGQTVTLKGEGPQKIVLPNGARLELGLNRVSRSLEWHVEKGYFDFQIEGIEGWRATGLTGQGAAQQWDLGSRSVAVRNLTPVEGDGLLSAVLVCPGRQLYVRITPQATFQFAQLQGAEVMATAAIGGAVTMYNAHSEQDTDLSARNMVLIGGRVDAGGAVTVAGGHRITVSGDQTGVEVAGELGGMSLPPSSAGSVQANDGSRLEGRSDERGEVTLKAVGGTFVLFTKLDQRVAVELQADNQLIIAIDMRRGVATIRGVEGNTPQGAAFRFVTSYEPTGDLVRGRAVELRPGAPLTIVLERFGLTPELEGTMVFYEAAGAGGSALTQAAAPIGQPWISGRGGGLIFGQGGADLDASRIPQPPVSTLR
jgi:hypothetical protein